MSAFASVESVYEKFGAEEPYYAVLTSAKYKGRNVDIEEFFRTGEELIDRQMQAIAAQKIQLDRSRALDFGCGVGRLTNALGRHFDEVIGVDISSTMIENAKIQRRSENCSFVVNKREDLSQFESGHFSFIYSDITIQHIPPPASENYIRDFLRLLTPGGIALFLVPDGPLFSHGSLPARFDKFYRERFRPFYKWVRGKRPVQIHRLARERVQQLVEESGGDLVRVESHPRWTSGSKKYKPLYYWARKK
ncbi:MAG: class I SAM-dependent methyltransferase [Pirellulales bacterium]|nr:class I SAM-dependent methyltransferase [Pirellulales bacterium]